MKMDEFGLTVIGSTPPPLIMISHGTWDDSMLKGIYFYLLIGEDGIIATTSFIEDVDNI